MGGSGNQCAPPPVKFFYHQVGDHIRPRVLLDAPSQPASGRATTVARTPHALLPRGFSARARKTAPGGGCGPRSAAFMPQRRPHGMEITENSTLPSFSTFLRRERRAPRAGGGPHPPAGVAGCALAASFRRAPTVSRTPHALVPRRFSARARKTAPGGGCAPQPASPRFCPAQLRLASLRVVLKMRARF